MRKGGSLPEMDHMKETSFKQALKSILVLFVGCSATSPRFGQPQYRCRSHSKYRSLCAFSASTSESSRLRFALNHLSHPAATAAHTHIEVVLSGEGSNEAEGSQRQSLNGTGPAPSPGTKTPSSGTPVGSASGIATASTSTSTAGKPDYYSHNPLYECLVCSRQVSSNRYAPHLAKCLGIGGKGARKGAARNAKAGDKGR